MDDITKILKFLEEPTWQKVLTKGASKAIKIEMKEQKVDFLIH